MLRPGGALSPSVSAEVRSMVMSCEGWPMRRVVRASGEARAPRPPRRWAPLRAARRRLGRHR
eukprot:3205558-Pyramimonas_sp.AAC.1